MKELKNLDAIKLESWIYQTAKVNGVNGLTDDPLYGTIHDNLADVTDPTHPDYKNTTPYSLVGATCIDSYGETPEKIAAKKLFATAMIVEDGETVKAGNHTYTVNVARGANGRFAHYSNPISFIES